MNNIEKSVLNYLRFAHTGALLISGPWGSGKTYFINNKLKSVIAKQKFNGELHYGAAVVNKFFSEKAVDGLKLDHYMPVIVSAFGVHSVPDLEKGIVTAWIEEISHGYSSHARKVWGHLTKLWQKSKKLSDWFDISQLPGFTLGLSAVTKNTVVIIDDLERIHESLPSSELMGMINKLNERYGLKVILLANESYLQKDSNINKFKEKVIEKTLAFVPDVKNVAYRMIDEFNDARFSEFMDNENVSCLIDNESDFVASRPEYSEMITNLRTVRFAINHFHTIFEQFTRYCSINSIAEQLRDEVLLHCWRLTIALACEYKANNITNNDLRGIDSFVFYNKPILDFDDSQYDGADLFNDEEYIDKDERQRIEEKKTADTEYCRRFVGKYLLSKSQVGKNPVILPQIVRFIVGGEDIDYADMLKDYEDGNFKIPSDHIVNQANENLQRIMREFYLMDNDTLDSSLKQLFSDAREGRFLSMVDFVNASTYLVHYSRLITSLAPEEIIRELTAGIDKWFTANKPTVLDISNFNAIELQIAPDSKEVYNYISNLLKKGEIADREEYIGNLVKRFETNLYELAKEICPQSSGQAIMSVNDGMRTPFLHKITATEIERKLAGLQPSDVLALQIIHQYRYIGGDEYKLLECERPFWKELYEQLKEILPDSIALQTAKEQLLPKLRIIFE